jgi:hypothetical protein
MAFFKLGTDKSWLLLLNYYVLQWTGWRLAYEQDGDQPPKNWKFVRMKPRTGWV